MMMVQQKIGTMPAMIFAFSTWVTLQSFHGFGVSGLSEFPRRVVWMAALSRNLETVLPGNLSMRFQLAVDKKKLWQIILCFKKNLKERRKINL